MSARRIDQLLAGFADGDAISTEALCLQPLLKSAGFESDIFVDPERVAPSARSRCRPLAEYRGSAQDAVIYHYSISSPAQPVFLSSPARKVLMYHNITPASFFDGFDDAVAAPLRRAREDLPAAAKQAQAVWTVSAFNAAELTALGIANVRVFPLLFDPAPFDIAPDPQVLARYDYPMTNILTVGRLAPNKRIEDLIQAFAWYKTAINPLSRLIIVGSKRSAPAYYAMLRMLAGELDLSHVCFEDYASTAGLAALYGLASVFVSTSAHEGYCLPLVEAMHHRVPVLARDAGGMSEALSGAGVLFDDPSPLDLAELIHRTVSDEALRREILDSQARRIEDIRARKPASELAPLLRELLGP